MVAHQSLINSVTHFSSPLHPHPSLLFPSRLTHAHPPRRSSHFSPWAGATGGGTIKPRHSRRPLTHGHCHCHCPLPLITTFIKTDHPDPFLIPPSRFPSPLLSSLHRTDFFFHSRFVVRLASRTLSKPFQSSITSHVTLIALSPY